ncbi:MAG: hypothetical protein ACXV39_13005, partial [Halobacteriota archaeon]
NRKGVKNGRMAHPSRFLVKVADQGLFVKHRPRQAEALDASHNQATLRQALVELQMLRSFLRRLRNTI